MTLCQRIPVVESNCPSNLVSGAFAKSLTTVGRPDCFSLSAGRQLENAASSYCYSNRSRPPTQCFLLSPCEGGFHLSMSLGISRLPPAKYKSHLLASHAKVTLLGKLTSKTRASERTKIMLMNTKASQFRQRRRVGVAFSYFYARVVRQPDRPPRGDFSTFAATDKLDCQRVAARG